MLRRIATNFRQDMKSLASLGFIPTVPRAATVVERWAFHNANKASPDGLIASTIVEHFAKHFDKWEIVRTRFTYHADGDDNTKSCNRVRVGVVLYCNVILSCDEKQLRVRLCFERVRTRRRYADDLETVQTMASAFVNDVPIELKAGEFIYSNWEKLEKERAKAEELAAKIKAEQDLATRKWDLAENLLGMKRDRFGALRATQIKYGRVHPASRHVDCHNQAHEFDCDCDYCLR